MDFLPWREDHRSTEVALTSPSLDRIAAERFKWAVLGDAVSDDLGLWEPLWAANSEFPNLDSEERETMTIALLRELFSSGFILFYRKVGRPTDLGDVAGPAISSDEVEAAFRERWWRSVPLGQPDDGRRVWISATERGRNAYFAPAKPA